MIYSNDLHWAPSDSAKWEMRVFDRTNWFYSVLLGIYLFTVPSLAYMSSTASISKYIGYAVTILVVLKIFMRGFVLSTEIFFFAGWLLWSLTGVFVYIAPTLFWMIMFRMVQLFVLYIVILRVADSFSNIKIISTLLFLGFIEAIVYSFVLSDYSLGMETGERVTGATENSNSLALLIHHMLFVQLAFFELSKKKWVKISMLLLLPLQAKLIIASGSKKGLIFFIFILALWLWFFHKGDIIKRPLLFISIAIGSAFFAVWFVSSLENTTLLKRLEGLQTTISEGGGGADDARILLAKDAWRVFCENPVIGVGVANYAPQGIFGIYAHNSYLELLSNGGLIGFVLMMGVFVNLAVRGFKGRKSSNHTISSVSKLVLIFIYYVALVSNVAPLYFSHYHWIIIGLMTSFYIVFRRYQLSDSNQSGRYIY
jgi:O-antigen ligase